MKGGPDTTPPRKTLTSTGLLHMEPGQSNFLKTPAKQDMAGSINSLTVWVVEILDTEIMTLKENQPADMKKVKDTHALLTPDR